MGDFLGIPNRKNDYKKTRREISEQEYNSALKKYSILIRSFARKLAASSPHGLDYDDFCSSGRVALYDALKRFDPADMKKFASYAKLRIQGAMLDEIRSYDLIPRSVKDKSKKVENAITKLRHELLREPSINELAEELGMTEIEVARINLKNKRLTLISSDDINKYSQKEKEFIMKQLTNHNSEKTPYEKYKKKEVKTRLSQILETLDEYERKVIQLYYFKDMFFKEIAEILNLTEARICQIHNSTLKKLQKRHGVELLQCLKKS